MKSPSPGVLSDEILAKDRLRVFVSSTIRECKEERSSVRDAILSLNHEPILFERLGAQPYPPRQLYLARLRSADIVVAIYKDQYGWIDEKNGMSISGLEDEYRVAKELGLPFLAYISTEDAKRDPRLSGMVQEIMESDHTVAFYDKADELNAIIRDDLTRLVTHYFYRTALQQEVLSIPAQKFATGHTRSPNLINREALRQKLEVLLTNDKPILIYGVGGIGKTVFLARYAELSKATFIQASNLTPKDLFGILANKLLDRGKENALQFATLTGAMEAFRSAWEATTERTVIVDDPQDRMLLLQMVRDSGGLRNDRRLILSARTPAGTKEDLLELEVTPLSNNESIRLVSALLPEAEASVVQDITNQARGIPLLIAQLSQSFAEKGKLLGTRDLWQALAERPRELISYIALSPRPLSAGELLGLRHEGGYSVPQLTEELANAHELLQEDSRGYTMRHERIRQEVVDEIKASPQKHLYLGERLSRRLAKAQDYVSAYLVALDSGSSRANSLSRPAINLASRQGDFGSVRRIGREAMAKAIERDDRREVAALSLSIAQAAQVSGYADEADHYLREAERLADELEDEDLALSLRSYILSDRAQRLLDDSAFDQLQMLKLECQQQGRTWEQAKIAMALSSVHLALHNYEAGAEEAREAARLFEEADDNYGFDLARRNLASALSALPGRQKEVGKLLQELESDLDPVADRRNRAWLCNFLVRKFRQEGRLHEAEERANEAIAIGHELGDRYLVALNQISLGNVLRDMERSQAAIDMYAEAAKSAQQCGRRDIEAQASRLTASVYNALAANPDAGNLRDQARKAATFARHAAGLFAGRAASGQKARALDELGDALQLLNEKLDASRAYFEAASLLRGGEDPDLFESTLILGSVLTIGEDELEAYLGGIGQVLQIPKSQTEPTTVLEAFYAPIDQILRIADQNVMISLMGIHFARMFRDLPPLAARFMFNKINKDIFSRAALAENDTWRVLFAAIVLCAGIPAGHLRRVDLDQLSEAIATATGAFAYKPTSDGGNWVFDLDLGEDVCCSVTTFDDRTDTVMVAMFIVFFLKGFEKHIRDDVLGSVSPAKRELAIYVANISEVPGDLKPTLSKHLIDLPCAVTRPGDVTDDTTPTFVTCRDDIGEMWNIGEGKGGALQILLGMVTLEAVYSLVHGQIEIDTLRPKIISVVRETIS